MRAVFKRKINGGYAEVMLNNVAAACSLSAITAEAVRIAKSDGYTPDTNRVIRWHGFGGTVFVDVPVTQEAQLTEDRIERRARAIIEARQGGTR